MPRLSQRQLRPEAQPKQPTRYARAQEFVSLVKRLWCRWGQGDQRRCPISAVSGLEQGPRGRPKRALVSVRCALIRDTRWVPVFAGKWIEELAALVSAPFGNCDSAAFCRWSKKTTLLSSLRSV